MDYKYIEQLLNRYWECETSPQEESILKAFFSQEEIPEGLKRYKSLFEYEQEQASLHLGDDFDKRVLAAIGQTSESNQQVAPGVKHVSVEHITLSRRLRPLFRAAAAVAIVTLLGTAAQHSFTSPSNETPNGWDYNQSAYKDSYQDPQKAYEASMQTLEMFREGAQTAVNDSAKKHNASPENN